MFKASGTSYQYLAGFVCQLTAVMACSAFVCLEPYTLSLSGSGVEGLTLSSDEVTWLVAIMQVGCLAGPPLSTKLSNSIGRKPILLSTGPLCLLGWLIIMFFRSFYTIFVVRLLQGILFGVVYTVTPIYTAEIAEPKHRGRISGLFNFFCDLGIVYTYILGHFLSLSTYLMVSLILPVLFMASFLPFPETPYFLLMAEKQEEAKKVLQKLRNSESVETEFAEMKKAVKEEMELKSSWRALFCDQTELKAFIILQIVSFSKFLTGMPTILNYSSEMLSHGGSNLKPEETTIVLGSVLCALGILPPFLSDFIGRRALILLSCYGLFISHMLTGAYFYIEQTVLVDNARYVWLLYAGLFGYCFFYDIGLGCLAQTLQAEMFSAKTRGLAASITQVLGAVLSFAVLMIYRPITETFGVHVNFWIYSAVGLIGGCLLTFLMFETKGKTIGRMQKEEVDKPL